MNRINTLNKGFNDTFKNLFSFLDNEYVSTAISLILVLYAGLAAPRLSENVVKIFDNTLVKLVIFFLIAYSAKKNPTVAIIAAVGILISLMTLNKCKIDTQIFKMANASTATVEAENEAFEHMSEMPMIEGGVEEYIPEMALGEIQGEQLEAPLSEQHHQQPSMHDTISVQEGNNGPQCGPGGCTKVANYKNSFYPQYVNMKPDAYLSKSTGNSVAGYDATAAYSSI